MTGPHWLEVINLLGLVFVAICLLWVSNLLLRVGTMLDKLGWAIHKNSATSDRIEAGAVVVAKDLFDARKRADAVEGQPGEASDAAAQSEHPC